jgi:hypothetical protein
MEAEKIYNRRLAEQLIRAATVADARDVFAQK